MTRRLCRDVFLFENGLNWGSPASRMSVTGLPRGSDRTVRERRGQSGGRGGLVPKAQRWDPSAWAGRVIFSVTCHLWRHSEKCSLTLNAEQHSLSDTSCVIPAKNCGVIQFLFLVIFLFVCLFMSLWSLNDVCMHYFRNINRAVLHHFDQVSYWLLYWLSKKYFFS